MDCEHALESVLQERKYVAEQVAARWLTFVFTAILCVITALGHFWGPYHQQQEAAKEAALPPTESQQQQVKGFVRVFFESFFVSDAEASFLTGAQRDWIFFLRFLRRLKAEYLDLKGIALGVVRRSEEQTSGNRDIEAKLKTLNEQLRTEKSSSKSRDGRLDQCAQDLKNTQTSVSKLRTDVQGNKKSISDLTENIEADRRTQKQIVQGLNDHEEILDSVLGRVGNLETEQSQVTNEMRQALQNALSDNKAKNETIERMEGEAAEAKKALADALQKIDARFRDAESKACRCRTNPPVAERTERKDSKPGTGEQSPRPRWRT